MSEPIEQQSKPVTVTFNDGRVMQQVVNLVVKKRPHGWSRKSYATYYKRRYAEWLKRDIDEMIKDRKPRTYRKDLWPNVSVRSLYLRVNQSLRYLLDIENNMDEQGIYKKFREEVLITMINDTGVVMKFDDVLEGDSPKAEVCIAEEDNPAWRYAMNEWLDNPEATEPFHKDGLLLTPEQCEQLNAELDGLTNIIFSVSTREVKIIKS